MAPMIEDDFVLTLSDADNVSDEGAEEPEPANAPKAANGTKRKRDEKKQSAVKKRKQDTQDADEDRDDKDKDSDLASEFEFDNLDRTAALGDFDGWAMNGSGPVNGPQRKIADIDDIVARRSGQTGVDKAPGTNEEGIADGEDSEDVELEDGLEDDGSDVEVGADSDDEVDGEVEDEDSAEASDEEADDIAAPVAHPDDAASDSASEGEVDAAEKARQDAFFAPEESTKEGPNKTTDGTFTSMSLSRPILKGLSGVGFSAPTPIQAKTVPVALEGKDIVGGAVTGSGKTAAFVIPILERLLYRPKRVATIRVAILMPTRELALQCLTVAKKLAAFTDITFGRAIGGLNSREQEKELKLRPDVVVATPGRFIDFMRNSPSFQVDKIEILVLDEADRMLEEGFADELDEILKTIPKSRQTMLFSATMTSRVDDLIRVGMQRPVRLMVDAQKASAEGLVQEFVRLRPGREGKRLGYLLYLCSTVHTDRVIIFFRQKKEVHRVRVIFALCGLKAAELHGAMTQEQRINAIEAFRSGRAAFLLATDLASRGLDIKGIETVINYEAPQTHEIYLHRVGRTARAGRKGISCTLAAEPDRKVVKAAVKAARSHHAEIRQRTVDPADADAWQTRCDGLEEEVEAVFREEKEERVMQQTEREISRAENVVKYEDEIKSRPKKTWFESEAEKKSAKKRGAEVLNGPVGAAEGEVKRAKGGKLSNKEKKKLLDKDDRRAGKEWKKGKSERASKPSGTAGKGGKAGKGGAKKGKKR